MDTYLNELALIDNNVYVNMSKASQKTIDLIQETIEQLDRDYKEYPIQRDELGSIGYEIDILLEVWDKNLKYDIETLKQIKRVISDWYKSVEFVNITLGIPRNKG